MIDDKLNELNVRVVYQTLKVIQGLKKRIQEKVFVQNMTLWHNIWEKYEAFQQTERFLYLIQKLIL